MSKESTIDALSLTLYRLQAAYALFNEEDLGWDHYLRSTDSYKLLHKQYLESVRLLTRIDMA